MQVSQAKLAIVEQSGRIGVLPRERANDLSRKVASDREAKWM